MVHRRGLLCAAHRDRNYPPLNAHTPKTAKHGALLEMGLVPSPVGFDWRNAETLVIQRDTGLEFYTVRVLNSF